MGDVLGGRVVGTRTMAPGDMRWAGRLGEGHPEESSWSGDRKAG